MKTRITLWRRLTQTAFVFLLNPYFYQAREVCFPILNCWGCPISAFSCPIGAFGQFFSNGVFPFLVLGIMMFFGVIIGRMLCGWACPFGFLQDLLHKIPTPKIRMPEFFRYGKYLTLAVMVVLIPVFFGISLTPGKTTVSQFFFCYYCPAGTGEAAIPGAFSAPGSGAATGNTAVDASTTTSPAKPTESVILSLLKSPRVWILLAFLALFVFISRPFCRGACPIGAIFSFFNRISFHKLFVDKAKCTECGVCAKVCPSGQKIYQQPASADCVRCLECQRKCPVGAVENRYF